ncbi:Six-hairpin glycosidase-like protein [Mycena leptocephala]|nr:Six-hairpin glycosidase-like protein [Mycena leptocephala]
MEDQTSDPASAVRSSKQRQPRVGVPPTTIPPPHTQTKDEDETDPVFAAVALSGRVLAQCPDYTGHSQKAQGNPSSGPLALPYMRPSPACRTFNSSAVEKFITDMKARLKDPDIVRLFENTFPNTLDTTNLAFIITGDITARCLRDIANQFAHYTALLSVDPSLATLVKAVINNEAHYVLPAPA